MQFPFLTALAIAGATILGACAPPRDDTLAQVGARLEERLNAERDARRVSEAQLHEEKAARSAWQLAASILFGGAILALIVGTILGSRARHDTEQ